MASRHSDAEPLHLLVGQHGLWGQPAHVERLLEHVHDSINTQQQQEHKKHPGTPVCRLVVLNSDVNAGNRTYDGVDVCGTRLAQLVQERLQQEEEAGRRVVKISFVGYSLGGLICRYAVGKLYAAGVFDSVQPMNFITVATPHLGSFKDPTTALARFFNHNVPLVASRTGLQLMLLDGDHLLPPPAAGSVRDLPALSAITSSSPRSAVCSSVKQAPAAAGGANGSSTPVVSPVKQAGQGVAGRGSPFAAAPTAAAVAAAGAPPLQMDDITLADATGTPAAAADTSPVPLLVLMCHPSTPFYRGLGAFQQRMACANIHHDPTVPYCTAAMCLTNPFEGKKYLPVDPEYPSVVRPAAEDEEVPAVRFNGRTRFTVMLLMAPLLMPLFPLFLGYLLGTGYWHRVWARRQQRDVVWWQSHWVEDLAGAAAGAADEAVEVAAAAAEALQRTFSRTYSGPGGMLAAAAAAGAAGRLSGASGSSGVTMMTSSAAGAKGGSGAGARHGAQLHQRRTSSSQAGAAASANGGTPDNTPTGVEAVTPAAAAAVPPAIPESPAAGTPPAALATSQQGRQLEALVAAGSSAEKDAALHEGISTLPGPVREQQRWMVSRLRGIPGGWAIVDVCTGHYHGHAAIVVRDNRFRNQRTDLLQYLADKFLV